VQRDGSHLDVPACSTVLIKRDNGALESVKGDAHIRDAKERVLLALADYVFQRQPSPSDSVLAAVIVPRQ
jgi:hypothetical protein